MLPSPRTPAVASSVSLHTPASTRSRPKHNKTFPSSQQTSAASGTDTDSHPSGTKKPSTSPATTTDVLRQYEIAKHHAKQQQRFFQSATQRLVNALADITVVLLTRAMQQGIYESIELRIHKKPIQLDSKRCRVAYLEYRNGQPTPLNAKTSSTSSCESDDDFKVVPVGDVFPGVPEKDDAAYWKQWFDVVLSLGKWWRFCFAVHKRIGWKPRLDRSFLNIVDSRVLGYVTVRVSGFM
jgi:hypothetical protein